MANTFKIDKQDLIVAAIMDEGYATFTKTPEGYVDACNICTPKGSVEFVTRSKALLNNDWSYEDTFASKAWMEHMVAEHDDILTLISMRATVEIE